MARAWKQYDAASNKWIDWPPGTLPSPESVFRAAFLNQFIGWANYLGALSQPAPQHKTLVSVGDAIQSAAFWNGLLHCDDAAHSHQSWMYPATLEIGKASNMLWTQLDYYPDYVAAKDDPIDGKYWPHKGDSIQPLNSAGCPIRTRLLKTRTRLDMMMNISAITETATTKWDFWRYSAQWPYVNTHTSNRTNGSHPGLSYVRRNVWAVQGTYIANEFFETGGESVYIRRYYSRDVPCTAHFGYQTLYAQEYVDHGGRINFEVVDSDGVNPIHFRFLPTDYIENVNPSVTQVFEGRRYDLGSPDYLSSDVIEMYFCYLDYHAVLHPLDQLPPQYIEPGYPFPQ